MFTEVYWKYENNNHFCIIITTVKGLAKHKMFCKKCLEKRCVRHYDNLPSIDFQILKIMIKTDLKSRYSINEYLNNCLN